MTRNPLLFTVFDEACPGLRPHGLWRRPDNLRAAYDDLGAWQLRARAAEAAGFHALFIADILGLYDVFGGDHRAAVDEGVEAPVLDPIVLVAALVASTTRLGFIVTASTTYEPPALLARRFSTLDALSGGRIAWNVVTSYLNSSARNFGLETQLDHSERYARAEEYLEVCYALWERSWDDAAVERDGTRITSLTGDRVHRIDHSGQYFQVAGPHLVAPTPQRTPVISQAGASPVGTRFAGRHAEIVFTPSGSEARVAERVRAIRQAAADAGRDPRAVRPMLGVTPVVAETEAQARALLADLERHHRPIGNEISQAASTGIDLAGYPEDAPYPPRDAGGSMVSALSQYTCDDDRPPYREVRARLQPFGSGTVLLVGPGEQVASELARISEATDVDGFTVYAPLQPATVEAFGELVMPHLRDRGLVEPPRDGLTMREQLGGDPHLDRRHPAVRRDTATQKGHTP